MSADTSPDSREDRHFGDGCADLRCLRCGYDLRGHAEEHITCPECGVRCSQAELGVSPAVVKCYARHLETLAVFCVLGFWLSGLGAVFMWLRAYSLSALALFAGLAIAVWSALAFRRTAQNREGALLALTRYVGVGIAVFTCVACMAIVTYVLQPFISEVGWLFVQGVIILIGIVFTAVTRMGIAKVKFRAYVQAQERMRELARRVAAREAAKRQSTEGDGCQDGPNDDVDGERQTP